MKKTIYMMALAITTLLVGCGTDRTEKVGSDIPPTKGDTNTQVNNTNNTQAQTNNPAPEKCNALQAELSEGANPCDAAQWIFDGTACVYMGGLCECTGPDCDALQIFGSEAECKAVFGECFDPVHAFCDAMQVTMSDPICDSGAWIWDGSACIHRSQCGCHGPDCDKVRETKADCESVFAQCLPTPPVPPAPCAAQKVTLSEPMCDNALWIWDGAACVNRSGHCSCNGPDCDKLFGSIQECETDYSQCISCDAMDVTPVDPYCDGLPKYFWNGTSCVSDGGACKCNGADCDRRYDSEADCMAIHQKCIAPTPQSCDAMDAKGYNADPNNPCDAFLGYKWNGSDCEYISGFCACVGADCNKLYQDEQDCVAAHAGC